MKRCNLFMRYLFIGYTILLISACGPKTTNTMTTITKTSELTDECAMKEEVCSEALDFQREYERMPEKEQKDMVSVLNTYIMHCEDATKSCEKSKKQKK